MLTTLATETIYKSLSPTVRFKLCSSFITMKDDRPTENTVATTHGVRSAYTYNIKMTRADVSVRARIAINNTDIINANSKSLAKPKLSGERSWMIMIATAKDKSETQQGTRIKNKAVFFFYDIIFYFSLYLGRNVTVERNRL